MSAEQNSDLQVSTRPATPVKRRKHLIDPNAPRQVRDVAQEKKDLTRVQQWVMSVLVVTTVLHLCGGLVLASMHLGNPAPGAEVGLNVIAGIFGVLGVAGAFMIHKRSPLTPWLLLGTLPGVIGVWLVLS